jgi:glycosyltransferase involved in cell wall biosynthesis
MKIALVHDYLVQYGGAERVLECFTEIFPRAPIFTLVYDKELMHGKFSDRNIKTSFLQKIPFSKTHHRIFPPLMPLAIESFDFSDYDVVLSDSSSFAKGIITGPQTLHICYMHTPMRFAWDDCQKYTDEFYFPRIIKKITPFLMSFIRIWDKTSADRPDEIIANSNFIQRRIKKYYGRESVVINPPVDVDSFSIGHDPEDYFLAVGRLMSYKKFDIVIEAFNRLGLPLKIIGRGPELERLKKDARPNVEFLGRVSDEKLIRYYSNCRAFVFPQEEDFGLVAIEAMACGRPIIAYRGGDIAEHMEEGKSGVFFEKQSMEDVIGAVEKFQKLSFETAKIRESVLKFDKELFKKKISAYLEEQYGRFKSQRR